MRLAAIAIGTGLSALVGVGTAQAAEVKMIVSNALKTTMEELAPQFEKATEHRLAITFGAASELKTAIEHGAVFDVAILTPADRSRTRRGTPPPPRRSPCPRRA